MVVTSGGPALSVTLELTSPTALVTALDAGLSTEVTVGIEGVQAGSPGCIEQIDAPGC